MLIEPAAVAWHACRVGGVGAGSRVAVVGDGAIWLAHGGLGEVDGRTRGELEVGERLFATTASGSYDVVLDAAGTGSALQRAVDLARPSAACHS